MKVKPHTHTHTHSGTTGGGTAPQAERWQVLDYNIIWSSLKDTI